MNLADLKKPFKEADLEWRVGRSGIGKSGPWAKVLVYVTNRAIQDRLDEVCGPGNWENEFTKGPDGGVVCGIGIRVQTGEGAYHHAWKYDGAENSEIESIKGGLSNAMKRAAVQWGIGRYLYDIHELWADITQNGRYKSKLKDGSYFSWNPPKLDKHFLPEVTKAPEDMGAEESRGKEVVVASVKTPLTPDKVAEVMQGEVVTGQVTFQDIIKWVNQNAPKNMGEIVAKAKEAMDDPAALKGLYEEISGANSPESKSQALLGDDDIPF